MAYRDAYTSFFKEHTDSLSDGKYWLDEQYDVELGEPCCVYTGITGHATNPKEKIRIKSYDNVTPGAEHAFGVSLDIRAGSSGVSKDNLMLRPDWYYPREITVMKIGICPVVNIDSGYTALMDEQAYPADGGAVGPGAAGIATGFTLGKWLEDTAPVMPGLMWVNPMMRVI